MYPDFVFQKEGCSLLCGCVLCLGNNCGTHALRYSLGKQNVAISRRGLGRTGRRRRTGRRGHTGRARGPSRASGRGSETGCGSSSARAPGAAARTGPAGGRTAAPRPAARRTRLALPGRDVQMYVPQSAQEASNFGKTYSKLSYPRSAHCWERYTGGSRSIQTQINQIHSWFEVFWKSSVVSLVC